MNGVARPNGGASRALNTSLSIDAFARELRMEQDGQTGSRAIDQNASAPPSPVSPVAGRPAGDRLSPAGNPSHQQTRRSHSSVTYVDGDDRVSDSSPRWLPWTLRWYLLLIPIAVSLILSVVISVLCWYSRSNYGLGRDDDSSALLFGWRFTPTLVVVLYCQLAFMIFEDVKRTEPFARMARPGGVSGFASILQSPRSWWKALAESFGRKKKGIPRSWVLLFSTLTYVIGFLALSPLSSSLLTSEDVAVKRSANFNLMEPAPDAALTLQPSRDTYFRTIGNFLQNVSTSAWIGDIYYAHPFWPASLEKVPLDPKVSSSVGTWTASSPVFSTELQCEALNLTGKGRNLRRLPITDDDGTPKNTTATDNITTFWFSMESPGGCDYSLEISLGSEFIPTGGLIWADLPTLVSQNNNGTTSTSIYQHNISANCQDRELFLVTTPWIDWGLGYAENQTFLSNFTMQGHICISSYYVARLPVIMRTSTLDSTMKIDDELFREKRVRVPPGLLDVGSLQDLSMAGNWTHYMAITTDDAFRAKAPMDGPGIILAAMHDFSLSNLVRSTQLVEEAQRLKQRFFGEILQRSLLQSSTAETQSSTGELTQIERRVVVVPEVGILMAVLFFVSFLLLAFTHWFSRPRQRPLHLFVDPSTPLGLGSLVASKRDVLVPLKPLDHSSKRERKAALRDKGYAVTRGVLHEAVAPATTKKQKSKKHNPDWRPRVMRLKTLTALLASLACLVVGLAVLKHYADRAELFQTFFVYQTSIPIFNKRISSIAPYSIVPTVLAVAVGLWWDSLDKSFRLLQPYLSMSKTTPSLSEGAGLQYQTSYWAWASFRAAKNRHWLLFAVTLGSTLSQVFIVSMSALFTREPGVSIDSLPVNRTLEIRQIPRVDLVAQIPGVHGYSEWRVMNMAFMNSTSNWMYTATIQLTLNGPEPAWSHQGWSFAPVDVSGFSNITSRSLQHTGDSLDDGVEIEPLVSSRNITLSTTGIRARVECSPSPHIANVASWLDEHDLTNKSTWNVTANPRDQRTGYQLPLYMFYDGRNYTNMYDDAYNYTTSALSHSAEVFCCANGTDQNQGSRASALGYWSPNQGGRFPFQKTNFTSKWIYGSARTDYYRIYDNQSIPGPLIFSEVPSLQALECMPIVETAEADVTVDQGTGQVYSYSLHGHPEPASVAWSDAFLTREDVSRVNDTSITSLNVTTSYGVFFLNTLLGAAQLPNLEKVPQNWRLPAYPEDQLLDDNTFNVRDTSTGLNMDFMSYSMYTLAGKDPRALLNQETLLNLTQLTFTTYFQHFVSSNFSLTNGGLAYQKIGEQLQTDLPIRFDTAQRAWVNDPAPVYPDLNTNRTAVATVSTRIEVLRMNAVATWLSVAILLWLMLTTVLIAALQRTYLGSIIRNFESPADVLVAIAGSDNFLNMIRDGTFAELRRNTNIRARLGWFVDATGRKRWGIEVVGGPNAVRWTEWPAYKPLRTVSTARSGRFERLKTRTKSFGL